MQIPSKRVIDLKLNALNTNILTYNFIPCFQKRTANTVDEITINIMRVKLYEGLLQYDKYCFHRQALNCPQPFCGKRVGKCKSVESGGGLLRCLTSSWLSLEWGEKI